MEFSIIKCKKCGYEINIPEGTTSVVCGSCGHFNTFNAISALFRGSRPLSYDMKGGNRIYRNPAEQEENFDLRDILQSGNLPDETGRNLPLPEDDDVLPEQKGAAKIMTAIFILTPFIAMAVDYFKLPPYTVIAAVALLIIIIVTLKKRS